MIERILLKLFKVREIPHPDGGLYLRRFFITPRWFPIRVFVHQLFTPDPDRVMHDHPWDFWTFPLSKRSTTAYTETKIEPGCGCVFSRRWHFRPAEYVHRITWLSRTPTWTIMITKKTRREWGFWVDGDRKWVDWRTYLGLPADHPASWEDVVS